MIRSAICLWVSEMRLTIKSKNDLIKAIEKYGFLPFFANEIEGFSIEEHISPDCWWTSDSGRWDAWEWKGPIIQETRCAYGKFIDKKAMYISKKWFYDFANYRRDGYDFDARFEDHLATYNEQFLYNIISSKHSIRSKDAKALGGYIKPKKKGPDQWEPRKGFDTTITKLQMMTYVLITDFDYEVDKHGNTYGWGVARYATPESFYGSSFSKHVYKRTPEESRVRIKKHLLKILPNATEDEIDYFLK